MDAVGPGTGRRVSMLVAGIAAQLASAVTVNGAAFLIPALQANGDSLARAGLLVALPTIGIVVALIAWGALADRSGERLVLGIGLTGTGGALLLAAATDGGVPRGLFLFLAGVGAASANAASGRVVVGWFPPERRGTVMGLRQMAQPLGVGVAALTMPPLALRHGVGAALLVPGLLSLAVGVACALIVVDPPRPPRSQAPASMTANPYRGSVTLQRIHAVSVLLVIPQFVVWTFALVWLISDRGYPASSAGVVVTVAQLVGALGRVGAGALSDRVGSRMRPLRWVAVAAAVSMALLALFDAWHSPAAVVLLVVATAITVADNGLAFTAVAEIAGPFWSGRALGAHNTAQFVAGAAVPPLAGVLIPAVGYPWTFLIAAAFPVLAAPLVPRDPAARRTGPAVPDEA